MYGKKDEKIHDIRPKLDILETNHLTKFVNIANLMLTIESGFKDDCD